MKKSLLVISILIASFVFISCSDNNSSSKPAGSKMSQRFNEIENLVSSIDDDSEYDVIIHDSDGWEIKLVLDEICDNIEGFYGVSEHTPYRETYTGPVCALYVPDQNMMTIICYDQWVDKYLSYSLQFDNPNSGASMTGQWLYLYEGESTGWTITATIIQGSIGDHQAAETTIQAGPVISRPKNVKAHSRKIPGE